jgi:hypothetical protein
MQIDCNYNLSLLFIIDFSAFSYIPSNWKPINRYQRIISFVFPF